MINDALFSSENMCWETPEDLFLQIDEEFHFERDVCATAETAKCKVYYSPEDDALKEDNHWTGICWMNPPYGREIGKWLKKAYQESIEHGSTIICLIPSRTDTAYWHDYCMKADEIRFIRSRVKFVGGQGGAPFPSALVIFNGKTHSPLRVTAFIKKAREDNE